MHKTSKYPLIKELFHSA